MPKREILTCFLKKPLGREQILRIMRITTLLLLVVSMQLSVFANGQDKITVIVRNTEWSKALVAVEKASSYRFVYSNDIAPVNKKIDLIVRDADLPQVMDKLLVSTGLSYKVMPDNVVVLFSKVPVPVEIRVSGRVTDENGNPLSGASIRVKNSTQGVSANANGEYSIVVPDDAVLIFSYVGYDERQISVSGQATINVSLQPSAKVQDQVVVIGYGTATKRDLTGSIVKLSGKEVADKPNINPVASLQGKVAGVSIVNSGTPGQEPDIRIRGTNSLSPGGTKPLYLVDGIFNDNINFINPNDIETIEILKDPSSLAIFGVRGANGVIAITTKKAKSGQVNINFNSTFSAKKLVDKIEMVNAEEFKMLYEEEQTNVGITGANRFNFAPWTGNTDWIDEMTRTGLATANNLSISSATDKNKFYFGIGYTYEEGIIKHEQLRRVTINLNDEVKLGKNVKIGFTLNGVRQKSPFSAARDLLFTARRVWPVTPVFNTEHNAYYNLAFQAGQMANPVWELNDNWDKQLTNENRMVGSIYFDINFTKWLNLRSTFYADMSNVDGRSYRPIDSLYDPIGNTVFVHQSYNRTSVSQSNQRWNKFQQDHILTFKKNFGGHSLTATTGFTTYYNEYRGLFGSIRQSLTGNPIPNNQRFWYLDNGFGDNATRVSSSGQEERATVSGLVRVLYSYQGKYLLNGSFRRDVSSAFRQSYDNQGQNFYSVGAAWDISKENFFHDQNIFDYLKLKGSWGVLGVQNTYGFAYPAYPALSTSGSAVFGELIVPVFVETYLADPNLHWETVHAKEIGIEFDMLQRRLHGEIVYYHKTTKDLLALISSGAGQSTLTNIGNMRNKGFEISATYSQDIAKGLNLSVSGNLTTYDNLFLESPFTSNPDEQFPSRTVAGYPIGYFYGYVVEGIFQSYAEKLASPVMDLGSSYGPGDLKYKDLNGDGVVNTDDRTMIGNPTPDFTYGGSVTLKYKGFDFGVDVQGVYGNEIYRYWGSSELPYTKFNYPSFKLNRWHGEGTSNWDPILGDNHTTNRLPSSYGVEDGSYFRIRNLQLGYNFGTGMLSKAHIKSLRAFINVQNLKTWKRNSGYSPEFGGSPTSFGIDVGNDPIPRIISAGINVNF
jgi:TonB-linked SusC/RagA family outer membrane protein